MLCVGTCAAAEPAAGDVNRRVKVLARVIDRNVGHAHMTRGMNMCTILALRGRVTERDVDALVRLVESDDMVHRLTAGNVLAILGPAGVSALQVHGARLGSVETSYMVSNAGALQNSLAAYEASGECRSKTLRQRVAGAVR